MTNFVEVLGKQFPNVQFCCYGDTTIYGNIVHLGGDELPSQSTLESFELQIKKDNIKKEVNVYRLEWMTDYFTYDSKQWDCDDSGLTNIIGVLLLGLVSGSALPPGTVFRDHNNTNHEVTFMYMALMASALMTFKQSVYSHSWGMKAAIDALTTVEDVQAYDITVGWPAK